MILSSTGRAGKFKGDALKDQLAEPVLVFVSEVFAGGTPRIQGLNFEQVLNFRINYLKLPTSSFYLKLLFDLIKEVFQSSSLWLIQRIMFFLTALEVLDM